MKHRQGAASMSQASGRLARCRGWRCAGLALEALGNGGRGAGLSRCGVLPLAPSCRP